MGYIRIILIFVVVLVCSRLQPVKAQSDIVMNNFKEKKEAAIEELKSFPVADTNRINALIKIFSTATFLKERQEVLPYRIEAMELSRKLKYIKGLANCYASAGNHYKSASNYPEALRHLDSALSIIASTEDPELLALRARVTRQKALIYYEQGNYYVALDHFFEVLQYEEIHSIKGTITASSFIARIYTGLNNLEKATEYSKRSIALVEKEGNWVDRSSVYFAFIDICLAKGDFQTASFYLDKLTPYVPDPKEVQVNFGYYLKRGKIYYVQQKYSEANKEFLEARKYAEIGGHKKSRSAILSCLSNTALKLGDKEAARKYAVENLALAEEVDIKADKVEALTNLANYYSATNNKSKAFDLMQQATELKDSVIAEMNIKQINILGAIYEADKQNMQIAQLQNEKDKQEAEVKQQSILNWVFFISIIALLIFGYLGYSNFKRGQQLARQQQAIQKQKIIELEKDQQLLTVDAMLKGQEEERGRIAKDLHDGLGSLLSGTKLSFMNVKENLELSPVNTALFDKSLSMLDNTIGDLRKVAQNMMPEALVKFGLHEAVRDFCESIQSTSGLKVVYQYFGEERRLDKTAEVFIYRIIQELVNNVIKHAGAREVIVQLAMNENKTVITVEDDGKGFDTGILSKAKGSGMTNIRYRMQYFNGTSDIVTAPGKGTSVNIELTV